MWGFRRATSVAALALALTAAPPLSRPAAAAAIGGDDLAAAGTVVHLAGGVPAPPTVTAASWLVADLDTGDVLAAHDAHGRYAPASTLKILTALTLLPKVPLATQITATDADVRVDGTKVGIVPGHAYTAASLFQAMLMVSGNDAATALASAAGGVPQTVAAMNAEAREVQAYDTVAQTVDGLDAAGQTSSAYDLALLARAALANATFTTDVGTRRAAFAGSGVAPFAIANHNPLLGAFDGVYGVKNGYTNAAQASYVGAARRDGHDLVVVVMRTVPDFVPESKALFDWGFAADGKVDRVGTLVGPASEASASPLAAPVIAPVTDPVAAPARRDDRFATTAWLTVGVVAGTLILLVLARREQIRRRRKARLARRRTFTSS